MMKTKVFMFLTLTMITINVFSDNSKKSGKNDTALSPTCSKAVDIFAAISQELDAAQRKAKKAVDKITIEKIRADSHKALEAVRTEATRFAKSLKSDIEKRKAIQKKIKEEITRTKDEVSKLRPKTSDDVPTQEYFKSVWRLRLLKMKGKWGQAHNICDKTIISALKHKKLIKGGEKTK